MRLVIDLNDEVYNNIVVKNEYTDRDVIAVHNALMGAMQIDEKNVSLMTLHMVDRMFVCDAPTIIEADKE